MPGFEPGLQTPEACIMPLYDIPIRVSRETLCLTNLFWTRFWTKCGYSGQIVDSFWTNRDCGSDKNRTYITTV